ILLCCTRWTRCHGLTPYCLFIAASNTSLTFYKCVRCYQSLLVEGGIILASIEEKVNHKSSQLWTTIKTDIDLNQIKPSQRRTKKREKKKLTRNWSRLFLPVIHPLTPNPETIRRKINNEGNLQRADQLS